MYEFTEPAVLNCLHRVITAFSRIGEYVRIECTESELCFSVINSSLTVIGRTEFQRPAFNGHGLTTTVHVRSKAIDLAFKSIESSSTKKIILNFSQNDSICETLEVIFERDDKVNKTFSCACLQAVMPYMDYELSTDSLFTFECLPSMLRGAFSSCERSADEVKVLFQSQAVNILARKRGKQHYDKEIDNPILRGGLKTIINLRPNMFTQITIQTPWQTEFKLREFRVMLQFFDQIGEDPPLKAIFNKEGPTTPMEFTAQLTSFSGVYFKFKFVTKVSTPKRLEPDNWLRVGNQTGAYATNLLRQSFPPTRRSRRPSAQARHSPYPSSPIPPPYIETPESDLFVSNRVEEDEREGDREREGEDVEDVEEVARMYSENLEEVGFTQENYTRGLFD